MRRPILLESMTDIAAELRRDREALGLTGEDLDARIGWSDRYTAKVENPDAAWGKKVFRVHRCADDWLAGLGRCLVIMDRLEAERLIAAHATASDPTTYRPIRILRWTRAA